MSARAIGVLLGLGAAVSFEVSYLLLAAQARAVSPAGRPSASFLAGLARRPWWLFAIGLNGVGFALELLALRRVSLVVVQPLLAAGLLGLVIGARIFLGERLDARRVAGAGLIAVGVTLVVAGAPASMGAAEPQLGAGSVLAVLVLLLALTFPQLARGGSAWRLVAAAGAGDTLVALATNEVAAAWSRHLLAALGRVGAVAICGLTALSSESAALQRLPASRVAPIVSGVQVTLPVLLVGVFGHQRWSTATGAGALLAAGVLIVLAGVACVGGTGTSAIDASRRR
jgi:drug/metabolite transporter (DMT)-like permease